MYRTQSGGSGRKKVRKPGYERPGRKLWMAARCSVSGLRTIATTAYFTILI
jgi:hypothetical protein